MYKSQKQHVTMVLDLWRQVFQENEVKTKRSGDKRQRKKETRSSAKSKGLMMIFLHPVINEISSTPSPFEVCFMYPFHLKVIEPVFCYLAQNESKYIIKHMFQSYYKFTESAQQSLFIKRLFPLTSLSL